MQIAIVVYYFVVAFLRYNCVSMRINCLNPSRWLQQTKTFSTRDTIGKTARSLRTWRPISFHSALMRSLLLTKSCCSSAALSGQISIPDIASFAPPPEVTHTVMKRYLDDREYKAFTLHNGLRVLLISDSKSNRSAAALDVHVGSFSDPLDLPGLAHFCEHMSFLGTNKYPKEEEFSSFLTANGGNSNAYTDSEDTVYYFDVNAGQLEGALDRFGQFFESPLFSDSAVARELKAIDSEHSKNIHNDEFRLHQLERDSANPAHPLNRFATGNKDTLETGAKNRGIDVRKRLREFHENYYTGKLMTLAVFGKQPLSDLEMWVKRSFSGIPEGINQDPALEWWGSVSPYLKQDTASVIEVVPVQDTKVISLSWPVWVKSPTQRASLKKHKPELVLMHLLGHEGEGSLRSALIKRGYIISIQAYTGSDVSDCQTFDVSVELTQLGFAHRYEVAEMVLAYVDLIKTQFEAGSGSGIPQYILDEMQTMSNVNFNYAEKSDPSHYVSTLVANMHTFPNPRDYLIGAVLFDAPDQKMIYEYLTHITPQNLRIMTVSPEFNGTTESVGRYYGTKYRSFSLSDGSNDELIAWQRLRDSKYIMFPELKLPSPNNLIPENFSLFSTGERSYENQHIPNNTENIDGRERMGDKELPVRDSINAAYTNLMSPPSLVRNDELWQVWHKLDDSFRQPKTYAIIDLAVDSGIVDVDFIAKSRLFVSCFQESISEYSYGARLAGLGFDFDLSHRGLHLVLSGFNDKMQLFAEKMCNELRIFNPDEVTFERYKEQFLRDLGNFDTQQPYYHASYYASLALESGHYSVQELVAATHKVKRDDLRGFLSKNYARSYGKALVVGNVDHIDAEKLIHTVQGALPFSPLPYPERALVNVTIVPTARTHLEQLKSYDEDSGQAFHHTNYSTCNSASPAVSAGEGVSGTGIGMGMGGFRISNIEPNKNDSNSASSFHFQLPSREPSQYMYLELLAEVLDQPFYHSLRTMQQLGYIVSSSVQYREGVRYLTLVVQSSVQDGAELTRRIEGFLRLEVPLQLEKLTPDGLDVYKRGITVRKLEPDQRLTSQAGRFWQAIVSQSVPWCSPSSSPTTTTIINDHENNKNRPIYQNTHEEHLGKGLEMSVKQGIPSIPCPRFQRRLQEVEALEHINLADFKKFAHSFLQPDGELRRLVVSQINSQIPPPTQPSHLQVEETGDVVNEGGNLIYTEIGGSELKFQKENGHV